MKYLSFDLDVLYGVDGINLSLVFHAVMARCPGRISLLKNHLPGLRWRPSRLARDNIEVVNIDAHDDMGVGLMDIGTWANHFMKAGVAVHWVTRPASEGGEHSADSRVRTWASKSTVPISGLVNEIYNGPLYEEVAFFVSPEYYDLSIGVTPLDTVTALLVECARCGRKVDGKAASAYRIKDILELTNPGMEGRTAC